jgi:hypothetical protein
MKLYVAYDEVAGEMVGIFSSASKRMDAVVDHFDYIINDPEEIALAVENDIIYSEHTLDEGAK